MIKPYKAHETDRMRELDGLQLASFGSRALALVLDFIIAALLFVVVMGPAEEFILRGVFRNDVELVFTFFMNWYSVVWLVVYFGISTYFGNGCTIGKKIARIRVVSLVHADMGLWHSFERALGYLASLLEAGFGFIQFFTHPNRRTVHDRIAETIVISERTKSKK